MDLRIEPNDDPHLVVALDPERAFKPAPGELERRFELQPEGNFRALVDGSVVGTVSVVAWGGGVASVFAMVVAPSARRRGVGGALVRHALAHAERAGARVVMLDATDEGFPLYEAAGFATVGATPRWRRRPGTAPTAPPGERTVSIYPISSCEVMDLWKYDAPRFGANRVPWLASAMSRFPERTFVAFDRASGDIVGYAESQERWIGPLVADSEEAAARLLLAAERAGAPPAIISGPGHEAAARLLRTQGYEPDGHACVRMVRGAAALPGRAETQWATSGWALA